MDDPLGLGKPRDAQTARRIKAWVKELWSLPETAVVMVSELRCYEQDCAPLETVITVQCGDGAYLERRLHKAMADIEHSDIAVCTAPG